MSMSVAMPSAYQPPTLANGEEVLFSVYGSPVLAIMLTLPRGSATNRPVSDMPTIRPGYGFQRPTVPIGRGSLGERLGEPSPGDNAYVTARIGHEQASFRYADDTAGLRLPAPSEPNARRPGWRAGEA